VYHTRATNEKGPKRGLSFFGGEAGIPALDVLSLATMNGAKTVRAEDMLGTIEPRKLADLDAYFGTAEGQALEAEYNAIVSCASNEVFAVTASGSD
jgi:cytosine/adenosine deaminase-related metal-dependent hydrolase